MPTQPILVLSAVFAFLGLAVRAADAAPPGKRAAAVRLEGALALDGRLDDAAWQRAPEHTGFEQRLSAGRRQPLPEGAPQTSFRVLYDDTTLYIGVRCDEPKMGDLVVEAARQWDAAMWSDDTVQLFFDPVGDRQEHYQFAVNTEGTQADLYIIEAGNTQKDPWSSAWEAKVFRGEAYWSAEIAIPFAAFHNRPSTMWAEEWVFSISRTRKPEPSYYSQYSPADGYHDVANFGTLGPMRIDRSRYTLYADAPQFRLEPLEGGFALSGSILLENRGERPVEGLLTLEWLIDGAQGAESPVSLGAGESRRVAFSGGHIAGTGKFPALFRVSDGAGRPLLLARFDEWLAYEPLVVRLSEPNYRNAIYATQAIDTLRGTVSLGMPAGQAEGYTLKVGLVSPHAPARETEIRPVAAVNDFSLDVRTLPVGDYRLHAQLYKMGPTPGRGSARPIILAESVGMFRNLPAAPDIEVRVSPMGNLLIGGEPVFIRGWYGSLDYAVGRGAFPQAQLPRTVNFIMNSRDRADQYELGTYVLRQVTGLVDEAKAKLDQPIDEELKSKLLEAMAQTRGQRNVIGYYISDEPECRGISPYFLRSMYEFIKQHDPYRMVMIVSRAPARYIGACDVICPHPYLSPRELEDGSRVFGRLPRFVENRIREAVEANDGSKAVWSMPQTFSYGGAQGRNPTFDESRFFAFASLAAGARGMVPFLFGGYWNHWESRVGMTYIFETLAFLGPAWSSDASDTDSESDHAAVTVIAKDYRPERARLNNVFVVAVNNGYEPARATLRVPALARHRIRRLVALRENRTVEVDENGSFTDDFGRLGVHVYTSVEVLPSLKTLDEIRGEIEAPKRRAAEAGSLLAQGKVRWWIERPEQIFSNDHFLADGRTDTPGWYPWHPRHSREEMILGLERPVTIRRAVLHSPSLRAATFEAWVDGQWKGIHRWGDQSLQTMEWSGGAVTSDRFRFSGFETRRSLHGGALPEISELELYER